MLVLKQNEKMIFFLEGVIMMMIMIIINIELVLFSNKHVLPFDEHEVLSNLSSDLSSSASEVNSCVMGDRRNEIVSKLCK